MNFKLFLPLTALAMLVASCQDDNKGLTKGQGTISPEFTIDYSVTNPRTMSRAENGKETVPNAPELSSFSFHLWKDDGKFDKTYTGLGDFVDAQFPVGAYSLEAFSGDIEEEGLGKPYFAGSTTFNVYDGEQAKPTLVAKLANTAVSVEYTEAFIKYFTAYRTEIHSSNGTNYITMPELTTAGTESEWAYVKPGNVDINITVTKQNGVSGTVKAATIENALPATHYHVTIDANRGEVGNATITVSFDDATTLEPIEIDVSGDILVTPAPVLTAHGFTSGTPLEILEGDAAEGTLKVNILAQGEVASVKLNISSPTPELSSLQGDVELLTATEEQKNALTTLGVTTKGVWSGVGQVAEIDFTNILQNLKVANGVSDHIFTITVVDKLNRTCEPVVLKIQAPKPVLVISNPADLYYGDTQAEFDFTYNGKNLADKVTFKATNSMGVFANCTIAEVTSNGNNQYRVKLNIPESEEDVRLKAVYNSVESDEITIPRRIQVVANDYDVWATKAILTLAPSKERVNVTSITLNGNSRTETFDEVGKCTLSGLTASTKYNAVITMANGTTYPVTFTTEAAAGVPNGDFEDLTQTASETEMPMGGKFRAGFIDYQNWETYTVSEPTGWKSINDQTCININNKNSWFAVPSTYSTTVSWNAKWGITNKQGTPSRYENLTAQSGNSAMVVRNVGWDANGTTPANSGSFGNTTYYCTNVPTVANVSAGVLSLDTDFATRPATLNGYYKYERDGQDGTENAVVTVTVLNGSTEIGKGTKELGAAADFTVFAVPVTYSVTNKKATALKIMITSSNRAAGSVKVSDHLHEKEASKYGAQLTVDNLTFSY